MYTFKSRVGFSECDDTGHLSLAGMINYFQDCSVFHSDYVGKGVEDLKQERLVWLLSSWKLEIDRYPALGEEIEIGTFATGFRLFYGYRNFFMKDMEGNYLVRVYSIWTLLNLDTGHPTKVEPELATAYGQEPELPMRDKSRKIPAPDQDADEKKYPPIPVCGYHLDYNQHMNNGRYAELASEFLPDGFVPHSVHISYKKAALKGNLLYPVMYSMKGRYQVVFQDEQGDAYCTCEYRQFMDDER